MESKRIPAFLVLLVDLMGFGLVYPLMAELFSGEEGLHLAAGLPVYWRYFYLSLTFILFPLAAFFGAALVKDFATLFGEKTVLILSMGGMYISFLLMGFGIETFSISLLLLGRALSGIMAGSQVLVPVNSKNIFLALSSGIVLGPLVGGIFSDTAISKFFLLSTPFYIAALFALITLMSVALNYPKDAGLATTTPINWTKPLQLLKEGFKQGGFLTFIFFLTQVAFSLFFQIIQIFLSTIYDYSTWQIGVFNAFLGIAFVIVLAIGVKYFLKVFSPRIALGVSLFFTGLFLILAMIYPKEFFLWTMAFLAAAASMTAYGLLIVRLASRAVSPYLSSVNYIAWILSGLTIILIPLLGERWLIASGGMIFLLSSALAFFYNGK